MPEQLLRAKEIHCDCGKLLAKIRQDGTIWVWCKACRREIPLRIEPDPSGDDFIDRFNRASDEEIQAAQKTK